MKRILVLTAFSISIALLVVAYGCEWNVPNEDTEIEDEIDCSQNPGIPGYDCGDACCNWDDCGLPTLYETYNDCVARCDEALFIDRQDEPNYSEGYKNCVLDCILDCEDDDFCRESCSAQFPN